MVFRVLFITLRLTGYDQGVFGGIIVTDSFLDTMGNPGVFS